MDKSKPNTFAYKARYMVVVLCAVAAIVDLTIKF